jgi:hypothetical protein
MSDVFYLGALVERNALKEQARRMESNGTR